MTARQAIPDAETIRSTLAGAHGRFKDDKGGANASYIPALAEVPSDLFGLAVVTVDGRIFEIGDSPVCLCHRIDLQGFQHGVGDGGVGAPSR